MTSFLFWNLNNNESTFPLISDIAEENNIDIILLAESTKNIANLLKEINKKQSNYYFYTTSNCEKILVLINLNSQNYSRPISESNRFTIRHLKLPNSIDILLAATHHISKDSYDESSQTMEAIKLSNEIKYAEITVGHSRTVLVGDLNMNPFEKGIVNAAALHAISSKKIAQGEKRTVQGTEYPFFYNPMWNFLGDELMTPPGTYYYPSSGHLSFFWNTFDQVLIRPSLLDRFKVENLKIVVETKTHSLLSERKGIPKKRPFSDHLPIVFSLDLAAV